MKKKVVPILVVLAVIVIGGIAFWMGRQAVPQTAENPPAESSTPEAAPIAAPLSDSSVESAAETPPAQSSTPEATPIATPLPEPSPEPTPELSIEPVADTATELNTEQTHPFNEALYAVYVKPEYIQNGSGVPVWDRYKMDTSLGLKGMKNEVFRTLADSTTPYVVVGVGYGDADGYIQILDTKSGITGYTNAEWFTQESSEAYEKAPVETQKPVEQQKPVGQQKPAGQGAGQQKPAEQHKPAEQQKPTGQGAIDSSLLGEYNDPLTSGRATIPEDQQTHDGGDSGWSTNRNEGEFYHGNISGS